MGVLITFQLKCWVGEYRTLTNEDKPGVFWSRWFCSWRWLHPGVVSHDETSAWVTLQWYKLNQWTLLRRGETVSRNTEGYSNNHLQSINTRSGDVKYVKEKYRSRWRYPKCWPHQGFGTVLWPLIAYLRNMKCMFIANQGRLSHPHFSNIKMVNTPECSTIGFVSTTETHCSLQQMLAAAHDSQINQLQRIQKTQKVSSLKILTIHNNFFYNGSVWWNTNLFSCLYFSF